MLVLAGNGTPFVGRHCHQFLGSCISSAFVYCTGAGGALVSVLGLVTGTAELGNSTYFCVSPLQSALDSLGVTLLGTPKGKRKKAGAAPS